MSEENAAEKELEQVEAERKPWLVVRVLTLDKTKDAEEDFPEKIEVYEPVTTKTFKVQVEADAWIKDNINEDEVLISVRRGKAFKAEVVRKVTEL